MGAVSQGGDTLSQQENDILDKIFWANHSAYTLMPDKNYYFALFMQYFLGDESGFAKEMWFIQILQYKLYKSQEKHFCIMSRAVTFKKRGHWFCAWGQADQNQSGSGPALAVDTK